MHFAQAAEIGPVLTLLASIVFALVLVGIGRSVERFLARPANNLAAPAAWLIVGWAVVSLSGAVCAAAGIPLFWPAVCLGLTGIAGYLIAPARACLAWLALAWLLVSPLVFIANTIPPTAVDEFAHWLPNIRFVVEHGAFPDLVIPNIWSFQPGYPPAIPIVGYGVHALIGEGSDIAAKIFSVLLAASFGLVLAETINPRLGAGLAVAIGVTLSTVANPFFDPRIALTAMADAPTGFVLAFLIYSCWRASEHKTALWMYRAAAASVLLVLLRETNVVLIAGVAIGLALTGRSGRAAFAAVATASVGAFLLWRFYIWTAGMAARIVPRPIADWRWDAPWKVANSLVFERLANNPLLGGLAIALLALTLLLLVFRWRIFRPLRNLFIPAGVVAGLWTAFLAWSYIAVFSVEDSAEAAAAWRYLSQLGPTLLLVCLSVAARAFSGTRPVPAAYAPRITAIACLIPGAIVLTTRAHWQIDLLYPDVRTVHELAPAIAAFISNEPLEVVYPEAGSGFAAEIDYDLRRPNGLSVHVQNMGQISPRPFLLDLSGLRSGKCPRFMRYGDDTWKEVAIPRIPATCEP